MSGPKVPRISSIAMLEYSQHNIMPSQWINYITEREDSRQVPSPSRSDASTADLNWPSLYGNQAPADINKDAFLGQYIHRIYCRECREQETMAAARGSQISASSGTGSPTSQPSSPPQYQMDQLSIAEHMNANKQLLTRKLMVRRSVPELVDAGIYPTSPHAFAGQRVLLERAKTGDFLKHKIERRPARNYLVQQHILDDSNVDPSLQSAQRRLKKAKLTDELNEKLAHRPGPLELVEQSILEAQDPLKAAIKEGKLEFHKTEEVAEPAPVAKLPYEIESPKSDQSSPEPSDCDNDSNSGSTTSTGFKPSQVPSPPDITPLLNKPAANSVTIGGRTVPIPVTTAPSLISSAQLIAVPQPQPFPIAPPLHRQHSGNLGINRSNRRTNKLSRPKQQAKQRVIKFHEYKGPSSAKSNSSTTNSTGSFVTTAGPMQKLDGLTPYEVRVQQQQLYLQCQIEVESKGGAASTLLVPIKASTETALMHQQRLVQQHSMPLCDMAEPPTPKPVDIPRSRPVTPSLSLKSPVAQTNHHNPLHASRSLSHLEDMKVADLKLELKQRNLAVSGAKPHLIERLRQYQLQELSASVSPAAGTSSELSYSSNAPSVQSYSEETLMAPPSVASIASVISLGGTSVASHLSSPPPTPCSPREDFLRSPPSVTTKSQNMEIEESNSQSTKSMADTVQEQAKTIETLQRQLRQYEQLQMPMVQQQPIVVPSTSVIQSVDPAVTHQPAYNPQHLMSNLTLQQVQEMQQQQSNLKLIQQQASMQQLPDVLLQSNNGQKMQELLQQQQNTQQIPDLQQQNINNNMDQKGVDVEGPGPFTQPVLQQTSPIDKPVYLAIADGKGTAYEVLLHTGNGLVQTTMSNTGTAAPPSNEFSTNSQVPTNQMISSLNPAVTVTNGNYNELNRKMQNEGGEVDDVDDVIDVLIQSGEMDPQTMNQQPGSSLSERTSEYSQHFLPPDSRIEAPSDIGDDSGMPRMSTSDATDLGLHEAYMDWVYTDPSSDYLHGFDSTNGLDTKVNGCIPNGHVDLELPSESTHLSKSLHSGELHSSGLTSGSYSVMSPKSPDLLNILDLDDTDLRVTAETGSDLNWDKLISQTSQHL